MKRSSGKLKKKNGRFDIMSSTFEEKRFFVSVYNPIQSKWIGLSERVGELDSRHLKGCFFGWSVFVIADFGGGIRIRDLESVYI
jgi:hypothetical protein